MREKVSCFSGFTTLSIQGFFLKFELASARVGIRVAVLAAGFLVFQSDVSAVMLFSLTGMFLDLFLIFKTLKQAAALKKVV